MGCIVLLNFRSLSLLLSSSPSSLQPNRPGFGVGAKRNMAGREAETEFSVAHLGWPEELQGESPNAQVSRTRSRQGALQTPRYGHRVSVPRTYTVADGAAYQAYATGGTGNAPEYAAGVDARVAKQGPDGWPEDVSDEDDATLVRREASDMNRILGSSATKQRAPSGLAAAQRHVLESLDLPTSRLMADALIRGRGAADENDDGEIDGSQGAAATQVGVKRSGNGMDQGERGRRKVMAADAGLGTVAGAAARGRSRSRPAAKRATPGLGARTASRGEQGASGDAAAGRFSDGPSGSGAYGGGYGGGGATGVSAGSGGDAEEPEVQNLRRELAQAQRGYADALALVKQAADRRSSLPLSSLGRRGGGRAGGGGGSVRGLGLGLEEQEVEEELSSLGSGSVATGALLSDLADAKRVIKRLQVGQDSGLVRCACSCLRTSLLKTPFSLSSPARRPAQNDLALRDAETQRRDELLSVQAQDLHAVKEVNRTLEEVAQAQAERISEAQQQVRARACEREECRVSLLEWRCLP